MVDEAGVGAHGGVAAPASDRSGGMLGHVLVEILVEVTCDERLRSCEKTYDLVIALVVCPVITLLAQEAVLKMNLELHLTCTSQPTLMTRYSRLASLIVLIKLGLAWEYALAANALEVVLLEVKVQSGLIRTVVGTAWLQTMFVL